MRITLVAAALLAALYAGPARGAAAPKAVTGEELAKAYAKSRGNLAIDPESQRVVPLRKAGGRKLVGDVVGNAGRRLILVTKTDKVAIIMRDPSFPKVGEKTVVAVRPSGTYRYRDASGEIESIPEYVDLTPSLGEFASYLCPFKPGEMQTIPTKFKSRNTKIK